MASVMDGSTPLQRAQSSGGVSGQMTDFNDQKFGPKVRLAGFGGKKPHFFEDEMEIYFTSLSSPLNSLSSSFNEYFEFMKANRKEDLKEKKGGLFKQLHDFAPHFFDFKVWKKVTGQARDPQVAALHQIRDFLIDTLSKEEDKKRNKIIYGGDPKELFVAITEQYKYFRFKFAKDEKGLISGAYKTIKGFFKEARQENKTDKQQEYKQRFGDIYRIVSKIEENKKKDKKEPITNKLDNTMQGITKKMDSLVDMVKSKKKDKSSEDLGKKLDQSNQIADKQLDTSKESLNQAKGVEKRRQFEEFAKGKGKEKEKSWLGEIFSKIFGIAKWALIGGAIAKVLGFSFKKGAIATGALYLFTRILPGLLWKGLKFTFRSIGKLVSNVIIGALKKIPFLGKLIKESYDVGSAGAKAVGKSGVVGGLKNVVGIGAKTGLAAGGKVLGKAIPIAGTAVALAEMAIDFFRKGGGKDLWKKGQKGQAILTTLLGKSLKDASGKKVALAALNNALKGAAIGGLAGGPIGALVGASVGGMGTVIRQLVETGKLQKFFQKSGQMMKENKLGTMLGGALGAIGGPVGVAAGSWIGSFIQDKLRDPEIRQQILDKLKGAGKAVQEVVSSIWGGLKGINQWLYDNFDAPINKFFEDRFKDISAFFVNFVESTKKEIEAAGGYKNYAIKKAKEAGKAVVNSAIALNDFVYEKIETPLNNLPGDISKSFTDKKSVNFSDKEKKQVAATVKKDVKPVANKITDFAWNQVTAESLENATFDFVKKQYTYLNSIVKKQEILQDKELALQKEKKELQADEKSWLEKAKSITEKEKQLIADKYKEFIRELDEKNELSTAFLNTQSSILEGIMKLKDINVNLSTANNTANKKDNSPNKSPQKGQ